MAYTLKRGFQGKYSVLTDDEEQVFGPDTLAAAKAWIAQQTGKEETPSRKADPEAPTRIQLRAWDKKLSDELAVPINEEEAELRTLLLKRRDEETVDYILREMKPLLLAGKEAGRRERKRFINRVAAAA